jgi:hypothetical protein
MIVETIRMVADWLDDVDHGANVKLAAVTVDAGDPQPPDVLSVADPTRDQRCAQYKEPLNLPALYVHVDGPAVGAGEVATVNRDFTSVVVAIRYLVRNPETMEAARDTLYALRAIVLCMRELLKNENAAARERNGVYIVACTAVAFGPWREAVGSAVATGVATFTLNVRDKTP